MNIWDALRILMNLRVKALIDIYDNNYAILKNYSNSGFEVDMVTEHQSIDKWKLIRVDQHKIKIDDMEFPNEDNLNAYVDEEEDFALLHIEMSNVSIVIAFEY